MRDASRIAPTIGLLEAVWRQNPDWRLGQVIANAVALSDTNADVFYAEDDYLQSGLVRLAANYGAQVTS